MKRFLALIILTAMLVPCFTNVIPVSAKAVTSKEEIRTAITKAYNELLKTLNPGEGGASDGAMQLLNHALFGGGEDLIMDETDNFSGLLLSSNLYRDGFVECMTVAFEKILRSYEEKMLVGYNLNYYEHKMNYGASSYKAFDDFKGAGESTGDAFSENPNRIESLVFTKEWTGTSNSYDDALILVVGSCSNHITIQKVATANNSVKYNVSIVFGDNFDFGSGKYEGSDTQLATALTWFGKLMQFGAIVKPFHFEVQLSFDITFDNDCSHQTENFRWELEPTERNIFAVSGDGLTENATTKVVQVNAETGEELSPYFTLEKTVKLNHTQPWVLEYRGRNCWLILAPTLSFSSGEPYLFMTSNYFAGGICHMEDGVDKETGEPKRIAVREGVGVKYKEQGYSNAKDHTYRLENRINTDGSNMVWLLIDGEELGPIENCMKVVDFDVEYLGKTDDWFNGRNLEINYIYNTNTRLYPGHVFEHLHIWENGEGNAPHSYYTTKTIAPTCTGKGYVSRICSQCGDTWNDNFTNALGHTLGAYTKKNDKLHSRICSVCGEEQVDVHDIKNNACILCDYSETKSVAGTWTTDLTLSAAELGVSAPDSVLRATLTFTDEGKVNATWEAVDLTALRLFFRDMFVSSYYAMAYGSGISDIQQIEQFCMDSTGMRVSAYMDTIVTEEAMKIAFTPESTQGSYHYNSMQTAIYTDLAFISVPSEPEKENSFTVGGGILYLNANSWGKADYTFVCKAK